MTLLALDLGTDCGFAIYKEGKFISGTKKLGTNKEKFGERFYAFRKWLLNILEKHNIESVYFERVYGHKGVEAAHCYGGFLYMLASVCFQQNIPCISFSVQAIKKFITAKGNATKNEIIAAVKHKGFNPETDDEADANSYYAACIRRHNKQGSKQKKVLQSPGRERIARPHNLASVRFFSRVDS